MIDQVALHNLHSHKESWPCQMHRANAYTRTTTTTTTKKNACRGGPMSQLNSPLIVGIGAQVPRGPRDPNQHESVSEIGIARRILTMPIEDLETNTAKIRMLMPQDLARAATDGICSIKLWITLLMWRRSIRGYPALGPPSPRDPTHHM